MTARVRWACPNGCPAVLGSTRPRRDDVVRYCLTCSARTGRLVGRTAPVLERARQEQVARTKARDAAARGREQAAVAARYTVAGVDLREALRVAWGLPVAREWRERSALPAQLPTFHVRRVQAFVGSYGYAWAYQHRIVVKCLNRDEAVVARLGTLLHELAHVLLRGHGGSAHGRTFRVLLQRLHEEWDAAAPGAGMPAVGAVRDKYAVNTDDPNNLQGGT